MAVWQWLRRNFLAGLFVTIPLVVTIAGLVWVVRLADRLTRPLGDRVFGATPPAWTDYAPGLGMVVTLVAILAVGVFATNVLGRRLVQRLEDLLMHVPVVRTVYGPVKQILAAFTPGNASGFKRVVLVEDPVRGAVLGFLTREFAIDRGRGPEPRLAVYVPTNHLYLGDVLICLPEQVSYPELTIEEGVRVFLTGGVALPGKLRGTGLFSTDPRGSGTGLDRKS
jgi:uncharacterized membrane protein